jgi:xanthine dehydrogenase accessory factor
VLSVDLLRKNLVRQGQAALIRVAEARGSTPRETDAAMVVFPDGSFIGTIGGGALEWRAIAEARRLLAGTRTSTRVEMALGPDLGQCCGGRVVLTLDRYVASETDRLIAALPRETLQPALLFGAGHVGRALALALAPLPFDLRWIDQRPEAFPGAMAASIEPVVLPDPVTALRDAPDGAFIAVMTHSHALDLAIVAAALPDRRFPFIGLIGSATKRARFVGQMRQAGLAEAAIARLVCPIGLPGLAGKEPAVIAAGIAAQWLIERGKRAIRPGGDRLEAPILTTLEA